MAAKEMSNSAHQDKDIDRTGIVHFSARVSGATKEPVAQCMAHSNRESLCVHRSSRHTLRRTHQAKYSSGQQEL